MDTISSRENSNIMPIAGLIAGVLALLLAGYAAVKASNANKAVEAQAVQVSKIADLETQVESVAVTADTARSDIRKLTTQTQDALNMISTAIGDIRTEQTKIADAMKAKAAVKAPAASGSKEPAVAGPGEYIVKSGDYGTKIARANGVSIADLQTVNPGVNWNKLHVGQKLKLPAKK